MKKKQQVIIEIKLKNTRSNNERLSMNEIIRLYPISPERKEVYQLIINHFLKINIQSKRIIMIQMNIISNYDS